MTRVTASAGLAFLLPPKNNRSSALAYQGDGGVEEERCNSALAPASMDQGVQQNAFNTPVDIALHG